MKPTVKRLDEGQLEMMWNFLRFGSDTMWNAIIEKSKQMEKYLTKPPVPADKPCGGDSNAKN